MSPRGTSVPNAGVPNAGVPNTGLQRETPRAACDMPFDNRDPNHDDPHASDGLSARDDPHASDGLAARGMIALIRVYQRFLSPILVLLFGPACRFEPSCSKYAVACIAGHGAMRGSLLSIVRLCKCHPFHAGGFDPPPPGSHGRFPPSPLGSSPEQIPFEGGHSEHTHAPPHSESQTDSGGEMHALNLRP